MRRCVLWVGAHPYYLSNVRTDEQGAPCYGYVVNGGWHMKLTPEYVSCVEKAHKVPRDMTIRVFWMDDAPGGLSYTDAIDWANSEIERLDNLNRVQLDCTDFRRYH